MKKLFCVVLCSVLLITGCSEEEPVEEVISEPDLTERMDSADIFGIEFKAIGPVCGFVLGEDVIEIHPYYNSTEHIQLEKILLSDRGFWETIKTSYKESAVIQEYDKYDIMTLDTGITYGYMEVDKNWAIIAKSDTLPSSYVKVVMDKL